MQSETAWGLRMYLCNNLPHDLGNHHVKLINHNQLNQFYITGTNVNSTY